MIKRVKTLPKASKINKKSSIIFALAFAAIGMLVLLVTRAATLNGLIEPEQGSLSGNVTTISDATATLASGGKYVKFSVPPSTTGPIANIPSNFNVNDWLVPQPWPDTDDSFEPTGNFRMSCEFSKLGYVDPIVYPGQANTGHLHMFFGNDSVAANSTYQTLRTTGGGTCPGGPINRTGYWMPAIFDANDGNKVVAPSYFNVYYKAESCGGGNNGGTTLAQKQDCIRSYKAFPNGLRMIAGYDMNAGANQPSEHNWYCSVSQATKGPTIPSSCPAGEDLFSAVYFPSCWDGKNLDSPNHRSHMAYISYVDGNPQCPSTHPVRVPDLSEFAIWENPGNISGWSLSSDHMPNMTSPRGSTFHADWFGAWDNGIEDTWLENCLHGMRNANTGILCNGKALKPIPDYTGTQRFSGYNYMAP